MEVLDSLAYNKLNEIKYCLDKNLLSKTHLGLMNGLSGITLFYFYYHKFTDDKTSYNTGMELLYSCLNKINKGFHQPFFSIGLSGYGWLLDHLSSKNIIDSNNDEILGELDELLYLEMKKSLIYGNYDFLHGALGYGMYFLKRLNCTKSKLKQVKYKTYLLHLLDSLEKLAEKLNNNSEYRWLSMLDIKRKEMVYNFSLSHGMSSIINFLSRVSLIEELKSKADPMLKGAIRYILNSKNQEKSQSLFPSFIKPNNNTERDSSRLSWCYGDLGIGISLLKASKVIDNSDLKLEAIEILKFSAKRTNVKENKVFDAGICHGAFGIANLFNEAYKESQIDDFFLTSEFWIKKGLEMDYHQDGFAGYKKLNGDMSTWINETSLLEGISGIGMVLMDYLSKDMNFNWNECILLS